MKANASNANIIVFPKEEMLIRILLSVSYLIQLGQVLELSIPALNDPF